MKPLIHTLLTILVICLLTACPMSSNYPLAEKGSIKIDENFIGTWQSDSDNADVQKFIVDKFDEYTYTVVVEEVGNLYTLEDRKFHGWLTKIEGLPFLVLENIESNNNTGRYYVYQIEIAQNRIIGKELSLLDKGVEAITSIEGYQKEVIASKSKQGFLSPAIGYAKVVQ